MKKRWLSILLVCGMLLTTLPSAVFAEGEEGAECVCTTACTAEVRNADCPTCGAEDAALEDCAKYEAKQENEPNDTQELADPQEEAQEESKATEPAEEPTAPAKSQVAVRRRPITRRRRSRRRIRTVFAGAVSVRADIRAIPTWHTRRGTAEVTLRIPTIPPTFT